MAQKKLRWPRRLAKAALWTAVALIVLGAAFQWWIGPAVVRWQVNRRVADFWDGTVAIGGVDLNAGARTIRLDNVVLCDRQGRAWLRAGSLTVSVDGLLSSRPVVRELRAYDAEVIVHCDDGVCRPPLLSATSDDWSELLDIDGVVIEGATLTVRNDGEVVSQAGVGLAAYTRRAGLGPRVTLLGSVGTFSFTDLKAEGFVVGEDSVELGRLTGRLGGGRVIVSGRADRDANGQWRLAGRVVAARVNLEQLKLTLSGGKRGAVTGIVDFRLDSPDPNGLTGQGMAFIKGADLSGVPMAAALLASAGLAKSDMLSKTDGESIFHFHGTTVTLDQGRLSLPLAAVDVEPGATIDGWTGQIDGVAVVVLFDRVRDKLKGLPVVGLMVDLTERFSRFRVHGLWHDDGSIRITPAAVIDVTNGTRRFLTGAARGRKRLGRGILDVLGMADGNSPQAARPGRGSSTRPATRLADKPGR